MVEHAEWRKHQYGSGFLHGRSVGGWMKFTVKLVHVLSALDARISDPSLNEETVENFKAKAKVIRHLYKNDTIGGSFVIEVDDEEYAAIFGIDQ